MNRVRLAWVSSGPLVWLDLGGFTILVVSPGLGCLLTWGPSLCRVAAGLAALVSTRDCLLDLVAFSLQSVDSGLSADLAALVSTWDCLLDLAALVR
mmetsp:Transcript_22641/g.52767  ORF Transcript_22641/g.52767 Transcript_22641/m.52767 type:complete len:96 (+) Transcript_22641:2001-2288(+)